MNSSEIIRYASNASVLIPLIVLLIKWRKGSSGFYVIGLAILVSAVFDFIGLYFYEHKLSTFTLFNVYNVLHFICLSCFYYIVMFNDRESTKGNKAIFVIGSLIYLTGFILIALVQGFSQYQGIAWTIGGAIISIYAVQHYNFLVAHPFKADKDLTSYLYVNGSVIVYFTMTLCLLLMANFILNTLNPTEAKVIWTLHNANNIMRNIGFAVAFLYLGKAKLQFLSPEDIAYYERIIGKSKNTTSV